MGHLLTRDHRLREGWIARLLVPCTVLDVAAMGMTLPVTRAPAVGVRGEGTEPENFVRSIWSCTRELLLLQTQSCTMAAGYAAGWLTSNSCCKQGGSTALKFVPEWLPQLDALGARLELAVFLQPTPKAELTSTWTFSSWHASAYIVKLPDVNSNLASVLGNGDLAPASCMGQRTVAFRAGACRASLVSKLQLVRGVLVPEGSIHLVQVVHERAKVVWLQADALLARLLLPILVIPLSQVYELLHTPGV